MRVTGSRPKIVVTADGRVSSGTPVPGYWPTLLRPRGVTAAFSDALAAVRQRDAAGVGGEPLLAMLPLPSSTGTRPHHRGLGREDEVEL